MALNNNNKTIAKFSFIVKTFKSHKYMKNNLINYSFSSHIYVLWSSPIHCNGEGGILCTKQYQIAKHKTQNWSGRLDSSSSVNSIHGLGKKDTACHARPHGICTWEQSRDVGASSGVRRGWGIPLVPSGGCGLIYLNNSTGWKS